MIAPATPAARTTTSEQPAGADGRHVLVATDGFIAVKKEHFFATVGRLNVHPRSEKNACYWETPRRELLSITTPGYLCAGPTAYFVLPNQARAALARVELGQ